MTKVSPKIKRIA